MQMRLLWSDTCHLPHFSLTHSPIQTNKQTHTRTQQQNTQIHGKKKKENAAYIAAPSYSNSSTFDLLMRIYGHWTNRAASCTRKSCKM